MAESCRVKNDMQLHDRGFKFRFRIIVLCVYVCVCVWILCFWYKITFFEVPMIESFNTNLTLMLSLIAFWLVKYCIVQF
jgi:hypothetical protein